MSKVTKKHTTITIFSLKLTNFKQCRINVNTRLWKFGIEEPLKVCPKYSERVLQKWGGLPKHRQPSRD